MKGCAGLGTEGKTDVGEAGIRHQCSWRLLQLLVAPDGTCNL